MKRTLTAEQQAKREERKAKFKTLWQGIAKMPELERIQLSNRIGVVTVEGRSLSLNNQCLLALQCPAASIVGGFRQWLKQGRAVRKGEHGAMIWVPICKKSEEQPSDGDKDGEHSDTHFIIGTVFDVGQTDEVQTA